MNILVDAIYSHNSGGKEILRLLIEKLNATNITYLLDARLDINSISTINGNSVILNASEINRLKYYRQNHKKFNKIICLSNVPPPINVDSKVLIYFHNRLLLNQRKSGLSIKAKLLNILKKFYIFYLNKKNYEWIVQTNLMRLTLLNKIDNQIHIYPIFDDTNDTRINKKQNFEYLYVGSNAKHKNLKRLLKSFYLLAKSQNNPITLHLTVENEFNNDLNKLIKFHDNLTVMNHGNISKTELKKLYKRSYFFVYPSLVESFGLPLLEAESHGCKLICADLEYVHEIVKPSMVFNPYSEVSIKNSLLKALNDKPLKASSKRINNKIDNFIKYITNDVKK